MNIIFLIVPILIILLITSVMIKKGRHEYDLIKDELRTINAMPLDRAKSSALVLLKDANLFSVVEVQGSKPVQAQLPQTILDLSEKYSTLSTSRHPYVIINFDEIDFSDRGKNLLVIGRGMEESDVEYELCVAPNNDEVYEVPKDGNIDLNFGRYSTIYHWILAVAHEMGTE